MDRPATIIILVRDTRMRNARELYRMRIENIDWNHRLLFNPASKTKKGRRFVVIHDCVVAFCRIVAPVALIYQPPELELVREALNSRHILRHNGGVPIETTRGK